jgi:pimeloyl-ACP methyl ester carboxylesterase
LPTLIYLPGTHGDWTLISSFRKAVEGQVRFVEVTYPRTTSWSLANYARHVLTSLEERDIRGGWILGESFGSQVGWALMEAGYQFDGVILAGGFVNHPFPLEVRLGRWLSENMPTTALILIFKVYAWYAMLRHRRAPETLATVGEFLTRRQEPGDREAMTHRLDLIQSADFRKPVCAIRQPVFQLAGFWDPIVPWVPVRTWLKRNCPGWRGGKVLFRADHTVLATQPGLSARQILDWMGAPVFA